MTTLETKKIASRLAGRYATMSVSSLEFFPDTLNAINIKVEKEEEDIAYGPNTVFFNPPVYERYTTRISIVGYDEKDQLVIQFAAQDCGVSVTSFNWTRLAKVDSMYCWTCSPDDIIEDNYLSVDEYPDKCPYCGAAALFLFVSIKCSNDMCSCYKHRERYK